MRRISLLCLAFVCLASIGLHAQTPQAAADTEQMPRMARIQKLHLAKLPGEDLTTYASAGYVERAKVLQGFIADERAYYHAKLTVPLNPLVLAVLNPQDWDAVASPLPYGVPSVTSREKEPVIVMPTDWVTVKSIPLPLASEASPALLATVTAHGRAWQKEMSLGADAIASHEVGHTILRSYGIFPTSFWVNEWMASYTGYVYAMEKKPQYAEAFRFFWMATLSWPPSHTGLEYFDTHTLELAHKEAKTYAWYQAALGERIVEVYAKEGTGVFEKMRMAFPADGPTLTEAQILDTLEAMDPGWKEWAARVEAGTIAFSATP